MALPVLPENDPLAKDVPAGATAQDGLQREARLLASVGHHNGLRLLLVFVALLLPLWGFARLVGDLHAGAVIAFDEPLLRWLHSLASPGRDRFFSVVTDLGYLYGVVPVDIALIAVLFARRRLHAATFATIALVGSALLNVLAKATFTRARPSLWESIAPEMTWSFPSGHAMGSATLAAVVIALTWYTRWRWPAVIAMLAFVITIGVSRVYLGVHYPSDILAGWAVASAWTVASFIAVYRFQPRPWPPRRSRVR
ncbi:MAG: phosphatase PAP2 family protein [Lysobacter sp.]